MQRAAGRQEWAVSTKHESALLHSLPLSLCCHTSSPRAGNLPLAAGSRDLYRRLAESTAITLVGGASPVDAAAAPASSTAAAASPPKGRAPPPLASSASSKSVRRLLAKTTIGGSASTAPSPPRGLKPAPTLRQPSTFSIGGGSSSRGSGSSGGGGGVLSSATTLGGGDGGIPPLTPAQAAALRTFLGGGDAGGLFGEDGDLQPGWVPLLDPLTRRRFWWNGLHRSRREVRPSPDDDGQRGRDRGERDGRVVALAYLRYLALTAGVATAAACEEDADATAAACESTGLNLPWLAAVVFPASAADEDGRRARRAAQAHAAHLRTRSHRSSIGSGAPAGSSSGGGAAALPLSASLTKVRSGSISQTPGASAASSSTSSSSPASADIVYRLSRELGLSTAPGLGGGTSGRSLASTSRGRIGSLSSAPATPLGGSRSSVTLGGGGGSGLAATPTIAEEGDGAGDDDEVDDDVGSDGEEVEDDTLVFPAYRGSLWKEGGGTSWFGSREWKVRGDEERAAFALYWLFGRRGLRCLHSPLQPLCLARPSRSTAGALLCVRRRQPGLLRLPGGLGGGGRAAQGPPPAAAVVPRGAAARARDAVCAGALGSSSWRAAAVARRQPRGAAAWHGVDHFNLLIVVVVLLLLLLLGPGAVRRLQPGRR